MLDGLQQGIQVLGKNQGLGKTLGSLLAGVEKKNLQKKMHDNLSLLERGERDVYF